MLYTWNHFFFSSTQRFKRQIRSFRLSDFCSSAFWYFKKLTTQANANLYSLLRSHSHSHSHTYTRTHKCFEWNTNIACVFVFNLIYSNACGIILVVTQIRASTTVWVWMNTMWPRFCLDMSVFHIAHWNLFWVMSDSFFSVCIYFSFRWDENKNKVSTYFF